MGVMFTLVVTKAAGRLSRAFGRGGGALPGLIAEKLDPHLARKLARGIPRGVVLVTGTNGKTTTTKLIAEALRQSGERVLTNSTGSNLNRGVTSALIAAANLRGKIGATIGLFEVDEASLPQVASELQPQHVLVLNLFRDQLDRYGELDTTAAMIGQGIAATKARLYLNADDPLVASLAKYARDPKLVNFFGIEGLPASAASGVQTAVDSDRCPVCHERFIYSRVFFSHIGHYRCRHGHFSRPQPAVAITNVEERSLKGSRFVVAIEGRRTEVQFPLPGIYNLYNALAALCLANGLGLSWSDTVEVLSKAEAAFGRVERVNVEGRELYLLLVKNPAGFAQVMETFLISQKESNVLFAINDLAADGRDVSWLWDVPLEQLESLKPRFIASGMRGPDMALRLHYAGCEVEVEEKLDRALARLVKRTPKGGTAFILPTYTAMIELRKLLSKITQIQEIS